MSSKKKKKYYLKKKTETSNEDISTISQLSPGFSLSTSKFTLFVTLSFFLIALIGIISHEMWRDEHQAWLVARDADSLSQLFRNMNYEGNPALWHLFLYLITRFTDNPAYMQVFHVLVATAFVFLFNRYAPIKNLHKLLFTFGYFPIYEYAVISRSYSLGILLIFAICVLFQTRYTRYIIIGVLLALLANVTIYAVVIACGLAGILILDYFFNQQKKSKSSIQLSIGILIFLAGLFLSIYQIWPEKDNSFPADYAKTFFNFQRWWQIFSKLYTTYLYVPQVTENFWNTTLFISDGRLIQADDFTGYLSQNPGLIFNWIIMPAITLFCGCIIFLRKPLILILYISTTLGLLLLYYYTALLHSRYCGYMLISLIACYWLSFYFQEKKFNGGFKAYLTNLGKRIQGPFFTIILVANLIGAFVAYSMDIQYKFSTSKDAAVYIETNKLDTLPIIGITDFVASPLSTYLHKKLYYLQMDEMGSFTIWSTKRKDQMQYDEMVKLIVNYMDKGHERVLWVKDGAPQITASNGATMDMEKAMIRDDLQLDLLKKFDPGIVTDEKYYIYLIQKVDPSKVDYSKYIRIN